MALCAKTKVYGRRGGPEALRNVFYFPFADFMKSRNQA